MRGLIVAGGDTSEVVELVEEPLDEVAFAVECEVAMLWRDAVGFGRDDRSDFPFPQGLDEGVSVIGLVSKKGLGIDTFQQRLGLAEVGGLARGQGEADRVAQRVDERVYLGGQSAS